MNARDRGRSLLLEWEAGRPRNFYDDDAYLRLGLRRRLGEAKLAVAEPRLRQAGADSAGPINRAAGELDRPERLPRLERWNPLGDRTEEVVFDALHHDVGRLVWRSGVLSVLGEPGNVTLHAALAYLFGQNGEAPHLCSLTCTAGLIKAIQRDGSERMRRDWLPKLLDPDYSQRWHGAQFLTEVQGGSDVGANACTARPAPDEPGCWLLTGEKWFCSNVSADLCAVSARPEGAPAGTPGIGLFVVPRRLDDGTPNGVFIRRLKNKLGTRTLPTAEVDFDAARAWPLGALESGFKLLMGVIINTSRLAVAVGGSGMMRRAWVEARRYAAAREAFGRPLASFPAVRQQLAEMRALWAGGLALTLFVAQLEDRLSTAGIAPEGDPLFRVAVNLDKYVCSIDAGLVVHHAIEILGGNGTIEDLSPLPRLYREVPVQESWEGPHNTLMAQLLRDSARAKMHAAALDHAQALLLGVKEPALGRAREGALAALEETRASLAGLLRGDLERAAYHIRPLMTRVARLLQVGLLLDDAQYAQAEPGLGWLGPAAGFLLDRHARAGYDPLEDPAYPELVGAVLEG
jgi:alkylation response protein AidB-like acyl-CoA dehydrogenase